MEKISSECNLLEKYYKNAVKELYEYTYMNNPLSSNINRVQIPLERIFTQVTLKNLNRFDYSVFNSLEATTDKPLRNKEVNRKNTGISLERYFMYMMENLGYPYKSVDDNIGMSKISLFDSSNRKVIICGEAGSGKSTLLKRLALYYSREGMHTEKDFEFKESLMVDEGYIPILIKLKDELIKKTKERDIEQVIIQHIVKLLENDDKNNAESIRAQVKEFYKISKYKLLLMFDGLDELEKETAQNFINSINKFICESENSCTILITSRRSGIAPFEKALFQQGFVIYGILPLNDQQARQAALNTIEIFSTDYTKKNAIENVEKVFIAKKYQYLKEFFSNPLLGTIITGEILRNQSLSFEKTKLFSNLLRHLILNLFQGDAEYLNGILNDILKILGLIAFYEFVDTGENSDPSTPERIDEVIQKGTFNTLHFRDNYFDYLKLISENTGIIELIEHDNGYIDIKFPIYSIGEYLSSMYLVNLYSKPDKEQLMVNIFGGGNNYFHVDYQQVYFLLHFISKIKPQSVRDRYFSLLLNYGYSELELFVDIDPVISKKTAILLCEKSFSDITIMPYDGFLKKMLMSKNANIYIQAYEYLSKKDHKYLYILANLLIVSYENNYNKYVYIEDKNFEISPLRLAEQYLDSEESYYQKFAAAIIIVLSKRLQEYDYPTRYIYIKDISESLIKKLYNLALKENKVIYCVALANIFALCGENFSDIFKDIFNNDSIISLIIENILNIINSHGDKVLEIIHMRLLNNSEQNNIILSYGNEFGAEAMYLREYAFCIGIVPFKTRINNLPEVFLEFLKFNYKIAPYTEGKIINSLTNKKTSLNNWWKTNDPLWYFEFKQKNIEDKGSAVAMAIAFYNSTGNKTLVKDVYDIMFPITEQDIFSEEYKFMTDKFIDMIERNKKYDYMAYENNSIYNFRKKQLEQILFEQ